MESDLSLMKSSLVKGKTSRDNELGNKKTDNTQTYKRVETKIKYESQKEKYVIELKEKKLLGDLELITNTELGTLKDIIKTEEMAIQVYKHQLEMIDQAVKSDCEMDIYEMYQSCELGLTEIADDTDTVTKNKRTIDRISLRKKTDKLIETLSGLQLGEIHAVHGGFLDLESHLVLQNKIDIRLSDDVYGACPCDMVVLDVDGTDTVVVTDWNNNCVKSFYKKNNLPCHSKLSLDGAPWSLTQLRHNQVAVTVPDNTEIVTVKVSPDLKLLSTFQTRKPCRGITAVTPSSIAIGVCPYPSVDILDMSGSFVKTLTPQKPNKKIIKSPEFLCKTLKNNILVSDSELGSVLCLTPEGGVVFNYTPGVTELDGSVGITVTSTGDILVADWFQCKVLHLTESGHFVKNILTSKDGLSSPRGLCVDNSGCLYVCQWYDGFIKVFSI